MILPELQRGASKFNGPQAVGMLEEATARAFRATGEAMYRPWRRVSAVSKPSGGDTIKARPWDFVDCDPREASFDVLLPPATDPSVQRTLIAVKTHARCMDKRVTIRPVDGKLIDFSTSLAIGGRTDGYILFSNGDKWIIFSEFRPLKWVGVYAVDFTSLADQTIVAGANTIDGKSWTCDNIANCTSIAIVQGTGLVFTASTTSTNYFNATRTAPLLRIPLLNGLLGAYAVGNYIVRLQARMLLTSATANFEGGRIGIEDSTAPTNQNYATAKFFNTTTLDFQALSTVSGTTTARGADTASMVDDDILQVIFEAPKGFESGSGVYDGSGYLNAENPWHSEVQNMANPLMYLNDQPRAFLGQCTAGDVTGTLVTTFTNLQADIMERHPYLNP